MTKLWVISRKGDGFVMRMHLRTASGTVVDKRPVATEDTLAEIRGWTLPGMRCVPRGPDDPPALVETWL